MNLSALELLASVALPPAQAPASIPPQTHATTTLHMIATPRLSPLQSLGGLSFQVQGVVNTNQLAPVAVPNAAASLSPMAKEGARKGIQSVPRNSDACPGSLPPTEPKPETGLPLKNRVNKTRAVKATDGSATSPSRPPRPEESGKAASLATPQVDSKSTRSRGWTKEEDDLILSTANRYHFVDVNWTAEVSSGNLPNGRAPRYRGRLYALKKAGKVAEFLKNAAANPQADVEEAGASAKTDGKTNSVAAEPKRRRAAPHNWTAEEDNILLSMVARYHPKSIDWEEEAKAGNLPANTTPKLCRNHIRTLRKAGKLEAKLHNAATQSIKASEAWFTDKLRSKKVKPTG